MRKKSGLEFEEILWNEPTHQEARELERPTSHGAFIFALLLVTLGVGIVSWRVGLLGIVQRNAYAARALANVHKEVTVPANRGVIVDRFGEVLARNTASFSVFVDAGKLLKDKALISRTLTALGGVLQVDAHEFESLLGRVNWEETSVVPLVRNISQSEAIRVEALELEGVQVVDDYEREYIDGPIFAHVIGYTGLRERGNVIEGKTGVEVQYDTLLRGMDGSMIGYRDALGNVFEERALQHEEPGKELSLTIDAGLQRYFHRRLEEGLRVVGSEQGVGLAINPQTGEVLSLISLPSFDNNAFVHRARSSERAALLSDSREPLFNRVVGGNYNPGSTIKPLHALAALHEGVMSEDETVYSSGVLEIANPYNPDQPSKFLDWKAHGTVDVRSALARSSNIYFYVAGGGVPTGQDVPYHRGLGIERLRAYWERFRLGVATGIDLSGEHSGFLPNAEEKEIRSGEPWRLGDTYNISIGQGDLSLTPLQLLSFIASVGNGGKVNQPYVVPHEGVPHVAFDYSTWKDELDIVRGGMEDAVRESYGTAYSLRNVPMSVAGKTGSAQIENNKKVNAFFVGYAPAENPEIAILVLVQNAREGSLNALPIAHDVLWWYYEQRVRADAKNAN